MTVKSLTALASDKSKSREAQLGEQKKKAAKIKDIKASVGKNKTVIAKLEQSTTKIFNLFTSKKPVSAETAKKSQSILAKVIDLSASKQKGALASFKQAMKSGLKGNETYVSVIEDFGAINSNARILKAQVDATLGEEALEEASTESEATEEVVAEDATEEIATEEVAEEIATEEAVSEEASEEIATEEASDEGIPVEDDEEEPEVEAVEDDEIITLDDEGQVEEDLGDLELPEDELDGIVDEEIIPEDVIEDEEEEVATTSSKATIKKLKIQTSKVKPGKSSQAATNGADDAILKQIGQEILAI